MAISESTCARSFSGPGDRSCGPRNGGDGHLSELDSHLTLLFVGRARVFVCANFFGQVVVTVFWIGFHRRRLLAASARWARMS